MPLVDPNGSTLVTINDLRPIDAPQGPNMHEGELIKREELKSQRRLQPHLQLQVSTSVRRYGSPSNSSSLCTQLAHKLYTYYSICKNREGFREIN
jgi:hypothetical protein